MIEVEVEVEGRKTCQAFNFGTLTEEEIEEMVKVAVCILLHSIFDR